MLFQFGGSLVAILAVAGLAVFLKLGGSPKLSDDIAVARAAGEVEDGFVAQRSSISRGGKSALARDGDGRIMVIKSHGNKFVGRVLATNSTAREEVDGLVVDTSEPRFGTVRLSLADASYWADAINRL